MGTTIRDLVGQILGNQRDVRLWDAARAGGHEALVWGGQGLDPFSGERILAFGDATDSLPSRARSLGQREMFVVTDARLCGSTWGDRRFAVEHAEIASSEFKDSILAQWLKLHTGRGTVEANVGKFVGALGPFFAALTQLPPEQRRAPAVAWPQPTAVDPSGAHGALEGLWADDVRARTLLRAIPEAVGRGLPAAFASDLVQRVVLAHRTAIAGPAMRGGAWLSAPSAADLVSLVEVALGPATAKQVAPDGRWCADFHLETKGRGTGKAVASTALGLASLAVFGIGWTSLPGAKPIDRLRILAQDTPSSVSWTVHDPEKPLQERGGRLLVALQRAVADLSYQALLLRVLYGWDLPYEQLAAMPIADVRERLHALAGPADLSAFGAPAA